MHAWQWCLIWIPVCVVIELARRAWRKTFAELRKLYAMEQRKVISLRIVKGELTGPSPLNLSEAQLVEAGAVISDGANDLTPPPWRPSRN